MAGAGTDPALGSDGGGGDVAGGEARVSPTRPATYAAAGVDIAAGEAAVERIRRVAADASRPEVIGEIGGFCGAFTFDPSRYEAPVLVSSTDGVGTKALVAQAAGRYETIGVDLVAMCVDDVVCAGAEPLFLLDYVATGKLDPEQMEQLVGGVADGCRQARCALLGGEMAEHPGAMAPGAFDLAGFAVGVVERDRMLGADRVRAGDVVVGLPSPGLRANGYTLAREVLFGRAGLSLDAPAFHGARHSLADELLRPSVIYAPAVLAALRAAQVHAAAHVTGGGIAQNLARVLPAGCDAVVRRGAFDVPPIFSEIQRLGDVPDEEMVRVFNLGVGMLLVVADRAVDDTLEALDAAASPAFVAGRILEGTGHVSLEP